MTYDVGRGEASGPYIRGRRAVNCPLPPRPRIESRWYETVERISLQFFPVYDPLAIYRVTCRNLDLESTGRSFFNCDVRFAAKEFSKGKEGVRDSKPRSCGGKRVDRERGFTSMSMWICESSINDRIYNKKEIGNA